MNPQEQVNKFITSQPEPKRSEILALHLLMLRILPGGRLWFENGKNSDGKTIANPTIGYGLFTIKYADGATKAFFQIGISANKTGISVYILGIKDKSYLVKTYGDKIGKAKVSGYCIRFKSLKEINMETLETAIRYGVEASLRE
jgi:hypothetical protein